MKYTSRRWTMATPLLALALPVNTALAQNVMPDPNKVPPEYRAAAEKRREELITINECKKLAEKERVTKRDLAAYVNHCKEMVEKHGMKLATDRPYANPEAAARANSVEAVQERRIHIELINGPFLHSLKGSPAEYGAGLKLAIERGWLWMHESGTYVKFTQEGAELFA